MEISQVNNQNPTDSIYVMLENDFQCKNTDCGVLVTIKTANGKEDVSLRSEKFRSILSNRYRKKYGKIVQSSKIKDCIVSYYGRITEEYEKVKNSNRCDRGTDGSVWIDCGNSEDNYFIISKTGVNTESNGCEHFYKHSRKVEIPYPDMENGDIDRIFKYCRVPDNMRNIFIAYLVSLFIGDIEHPCLVLNGGQGSGKTTMSIFVKSLIDPVADSRPSIFPKNDADLALMFRDNYLLAFDNLQTLNIRLSDKLCTIVTGITDSRRKLYTDDEMMHIDLCQPIILNGIHEIVKQEDMLSRSIVMTLTKPSSERKAVGEKISLMDEFMRDRPIILGGIFKIMVEALRNYKPNSVSRLKTDIRMSSFYDYGYYICEAWKGKGIDFCADYISLLNEQLKDFQKRSELVEIIKCFLEENDYEWEGMMKWFCEILNDFVREFWSDDDIKIPSTPNRLSREIGSLQNELKMAGIIVGMSKTKNNSRYIRLSLEDE